VVLHQVDHQVELILEAQGGTKDGKFH
jgi:hypothetical protein